MNPGFVRFAEEDGCICADGCGRFEIDKESKNIRVEGIVCGVISRKSVREFCLDGPKSLPELYLNYMNGEKEERRLFVGQVENIIEARRWIERLNESYRK